MHPNAELTDEGGCPPTVSKRKTVSAIFPFTFCTCSHATSVLGSSGLGRLPTPRPSVYASAFPANLPLDVKSHFGETPWPPVGFGTK